jgi:hypothetical protein
MMSEVMSSRIDEAQAISTAEEIVGSVRTNGGEVRVLGGVGVALRCASMRNGMQLGRDYSDIDVVTTKRSAPTLTRTLEELEFIPARRFNSLHGHSRMMFDRADGIHLDVFVDTFAMCHKLDLGSRLEFNDTTISLADLLLTKLQVAELNRKDISDAAALLLDHELTDGEQGLNRDYITNLLARDWGWWRTVTENLASVGTHLTGILDPPANDAVQGRLADLATAIEQAPKSRRWRTRAKIGERVPWREEPEESH